MGLYSLKSSLQYLTQFFLEIQILSAIERRYLLADIPNKNFCHAKSNKIKNQNFRRSVSGLRSEILEF
ncbi:MULTISPECIES: hypothetical protein [unclassified Campylobacter]|uniref:hypothetical protein n=1 Tax=unclassified Campylobacter TaxID=2593542 RepID=UPI0022E9D1B9|nr:MULTISPECIES: hypothetical protein [unclassified Campylobacter]MDA3047707.1 hypothetical protein [Campylobacter sp. JMF_08 NE1]MDA3053935.1 hypothetical protein [Campylobacter sp. VBCF_07 NA4]MDA3060178.1 hypothetical protein [Campylobacter sp. VBCF_02 NA5]MDA3069692.1 hypothetical protein [Campylobacter sp. VBCF_08 NA3]WBR54976.1 hypothetical protein PF027_03635 [Campylobacter sp. VBCF_01 NA2]